MQLGLLRLARHCERSFIISDQSRAVRHNCTVTGVANIRHSSGVKEHVRKKHLTALRLMRRMRAPSRTVCAVLNCSTAASSVATRSGFPAAATRARYAQHPGGGT